MIVSGNTNWTKATLSQVVDILDSNRKPINADERDKRIAGKSKSELFPYYGATGQVGWIDDFLLDGEYVLVGEDGAPFLEQFKDKAYIVKGKVWVNNHAHVLLAKQGVSVNQFVCHYLNFFNYSHFVSGTTRLKLTKGRLCEIPIPIPSFDEQKRIVAKIEELFSDLDKAVESLKKAQAQLKTYRQAVLKYAFEGRLTDKNIKPGQLPDGWKWVTLGETGLVSRGMSKNRPRDAKELYGGKYPFIQTGDVRKANGGTIVEYTQTYSEAGLKQSKLWPKGTLCITIAANIADTAFLGFDACFPDSIVGYVANNQITTAKFINYYIIRFKSNLEKLAPATAQKNINVRILNQINVPLAPITEQCEIVQQIETRLSEADYMEKTIIQSIGKAEATRQSILKKAFEGRLV